ncbi:MAG TPA: hypothetical protein LFW20_00560 [Rickettsia endosymbiont of Omalisus fontisbellaquei]|nr:hypothetical protein [Rickettsia endosymbiont of Omalisus fontisbellaquei]
MDPVVKPRDDILAII